MNYKQSQDFKHQNLKFLTYNVQGLNSKLENEDFVNFVKSYDFVCLTETFIDGSFDRESFPEHIIFESKSMRYSKFGRTQGGVMVLIKKTFARFVSQIELQYDNLIAIIINPELTGTNKKVIFLSCYLPPQESRFWIDINAHDSKGPEVLEEALLEIYDKVEEFHLILCGDMNARTSNHSIHTLNLDNPDHDSEECNDFQRSSYDKKSNLFGNQLLELCQMTDSAILNGLHKFGHFEDGYTYISKQGSSTIDYFIASTEMITKELFVNLSIKERLDSDHMPVELIMKTKVPCFSNTQE